MNERQASVYAHTLHRCRHAATLCTPFAKADTQRLETARLAGGPVVFPAPDRNSFMRHGEKTPFCWQEAVSTQYRLHQMPRSCARTLPFGNASRVAELRQVRGLGSSVQEVNRHDGERIVFGDLSPRKGRGTCSALTSPGPIAKLELLSHLEEVVDAGCDKLVLGSGQAESR